MTRSRYRQLQVADIARRFAAVLLNYDEQNLPPLRRPFQKSCRARSAPSFSDQTKLRPSDATSIFRFSQCSSEYLPRAGLLHKSNDAQVPLVVAGF
jgi:hypothetical protein